MRLCCECFLELTGYDFSATESGCAGGVFGGMFFLEGCFVFIQTELTPNPAVVKFLPGVDVLPTGTAEFCSRGEAEGVSDLAYALFGIEGVSSVFFGRDFVSVAKLSSVDWDILRPPILGLIMEHCMSGRPFVREGSVSGDGGGEGGGEEVFSESDAAIVAKIKELLDERVRPAVAQDGGDIVFHGFEKGIVYLTLRGACAGCPSSTMTLKMGVENLLRHYIPEVSEVRARA